MSRFQSLLKKTTSFDKLQSLMALDLGSAQTKVLFDKRVVWHQPTVVAWHSERQAVVAIGDKAYHLAGKTPRMIQLIFPVRDGVVANGAMATVYLELLLRELHTMTIIKSLLHPRCRVAVPAGASPVEREFLTRHVRAAGLSIDTLVSKPAAIIAGLGGSRGQQVMGCIDIGAQTVEIGLFAGGESVMVNTLRGFGTERWIKSAQQQIKAVHSCDVGWEAAEKVIKDVAYVSLSGSQTAPVTVIRGRDARTSVVTTIRITGELLHEALVASVQEILSELQLLLASAPSDVVTQVLTNGLYIAGGGAQLRGLADVFSHELGSEVQVLSQPETAVVAGLLS